MREVRVLCYIIYCELLVAASSGVCSLQMIFSWLGVKGWLLLFSVGSWRFGQTFDRMLGFLKKPVVVTVEINMNLVALTVMGLISRLWGLSYPRAVVWVEWFIFHLNDKDFWFSKHLWVRTQEQKISACLMSVSVNTMILFPSETLLGDKGKAPAVHCTLSLLPTDPCFLPCVPVACRIIPVRFDAFLPLVFQFRWSLLRPIRFALHEEDLLCGWQRPASWPHAARFGR